MQCREVTARSVIVAIYRHGRLEGGFCRDGIAARGISKPEMVANFGTLRLELCCHLQLSDGLLNRACIESACSALIQIRRSPAAAANGTKPSRQREAEREQTSRARDARGAPSDTSSCDTCAFHVGPSIFGVYHCLEPIVASPRPWYS